MAEAHARGERIERVDLTSLNRLLEHKAEDMTATAQAGMTLAELQRQLRGRGQWLPIDPPVADGLSIAALLETNASGPRRFGYGMIRDYVIGLQAVLADGRLIHSGGKVVKNVAGYDLMKLFIGSRGSIGIIAEATFKVLPVVEAEEFVEALCDTAQQADKLIEAVLKSALMPIVLDLHNLSAGPRWSVVIGLAGTRAEMDWQLSCAAELGLTRPTTLDYQERFFAEKGPLQTLSVLPSRTCEWAARLGAVDFVARAGNGIIYHRGEPVAPAPGQAGTKDLEERVKKEFDPKGLLAELAPVKRK